MLGAIIGDIVGSVYEFNPTDDYNFEMFKKGSSFTDDTICTIAVADALLKGRDYGESIHEWCRKYPNPSGGYGGSFNLWVLSDKPKPYGSFGNGSAMRVSPIGMWYTNDLERLLEEAKKSAECTHNHPEGIKGAQCIAEAIRMAQSDDFGVFEYCGDKEEFAKDIRDYVLSAYDYDIEIDYENYRGIFNETCQGTVPQALDIIGRSTGFEDAIRRAVSLGADADTLGAIVGSIAERIWGIPDDIRKKALSYLTDEMRSVVEEFYHTLEVREGVTADGIAPKNFEYFMSCDIAGTSHIHSQFIFKEIKQLDILELRHENNPYDHLAVAIYFRNTKIGYVPRKQNEALGRLLMAGWENRIIAHVVDILNENNYYRVHIRIDIQRCGVISTEKPTRFRNETFVQEDPFMFDKEAFNTYNKSEKAQLYYSTGGRTGTLPGRTTPDKIDKLEENEIFVFGSNEEGHHNGGAALLALNRFGAVYGNGHGLQGKSYAISTMEGLISTARNINTFIDFASEHQELRFFVTAIGCGIAGYNPLQIAPLFSRAIILPNVFLPLIFWEYFWQTNEYHPDYFLPSSDWDKWNKLS